MIRERTPAKARVLLLACGIAAPVWWIAMDVAGSLRYPGYSYADQTISELSAVGAPTATFMLVASGIPYALLMVAFGAGVWIAAGASRTGRITGALLAIEAMFGLIGGLAFPMATREVIAAGQETLRNELHAPYGLGMPILFVLVVLFGSRLLGGRFRLYSYATIVVTFAFGAMTALQTDQLRADQPTPWLGVVERVTAYLPLIWVAVLAACLLRAEGSTATRDTRAATGRDGRL